MVLIWSIVLLFAFSFVFSRPVRHAGIGFWRDSIVVITMVLVQLLIAITVGRFLDRICYGRPWFRKAFEGTQIARGNGAARFLMNCPSGWMTIIGGLCRSWPI